MSLTWREYVANKPRFIGLDSALLLGPGGTNHVRNPRFAGLVTGSPGTMPTNTSAGSAGGLTRTIVGAGVTSGVPWFDVRIQGTSTDSSLWFVFTPDVGPALPVVAGQTSTGSIFVALVAGSIPGTGLLRLVHDVRDAGSVNLAFLTALSFTPTSTLTRYVGPQLVSNPSAAGVRLNVWGPSGTGQVVDFTLRLGWPQHQIGAVTNPILPPVGSPAASAIGADLPSAPLASLGIGPSGSSTWWFDFEFLSPSGINETLVCVDDGGVNNRLQMRRTDNGFATALRTNGGVALSTQSGALVTGVRYGGAFRIGGDGTARAVVSGLSTNDVVDGPTSGLITVRLNNIPGPDQTSHRRTRRVQYLPYAVSDATLDTLAAQAAAW